MSEEEKTNEDVVLETSEEEEGVKYEPVHLKTKTIPAIVMLLGGLVVTVDVFIQQLEFKRSLIIILVSLVAFLIVGDIVKILLDRIELPNPEAVDSDGNVIEKGKGAEEENISAGEETEEAPAEQSEGTEET